MKKLFFLLFTTITLSQNFDESFLDGTIMFKLNYFIEADENNNEKINDGIGLIDDIRNYPFIEEIFSPKFILIPLFFIAPVNAEESSKSNPLKICSPLTN